MLFSRQSAQVHAAWFQKSVVRGVQVHFSQRLLASALLYSYEVEGKLSNIMLMSCMLGLAEAGSQKRSMQKELLDCQCCCIMPSECR